jgi:hypothetical protein
MSDHSAADSDWANGDALATRDGGRLEPGRSRPRRLRSDRLPRGRPVSRVRPGTSVSVQAKTAPGTAPNRTKLTDRTHDAPSHAGRPWRSGREMGAPGIEPCACVSARTAATGSNRRKSASSRDFAPTGEAGNGSKRQLRRASLRPRFHRCFTQGFTPSQIQAATNRGCSEWGSRAESGLSRVVSEPATSGVTGQHGATGLRRPLTRH